MKATMGTILSTLWLTACGSSIFSAVESKDPATEATVALEKNHPQEAIDILTAALKKHPNNYTYISLLASAKAKLVGIDFMRVILKMASNGSSQDSSSSTSSSTSSATTDAQGNDVTFLFSAMPEATQTNLDGLDEAISLMESIPEESLIPADEFKKTVFYTSRLALRTKKFDKNGDGLVSPVELLDLDDADADVIMESLFSASNSLEAAGAEGVSAEQINTIKDAIANSPGDSTAERLRNYLGGTSSTSTTTTSLR